MEVNSVNLMQYAVGGASLFILIAVGIIALFIKGRKSRIEKKEEKARKKEEGSPLQQTNKQQVNQRQQVNQKQQVRQAQRVEQPKEVAPQAASSQNQQAEEMQELQQRQIMQRLRESQQQHVKQAMQSPPVQPRVNQEVEPSLQAQQNQEANLRQQVQPNQKLNEMPTLEIAFYKVQTTSRGENKAFFLDEYLNVGRNEDTNDWVIGDDPTVSGNHCRIYQKDGELYILDLNSTNGTYVNEERVFGEMKLENHDKIRMGQSAYRIKF